MVTKNKNRPKFHKYMQNSTKQKVWNYMRRNRTFRFGDVMMVTGVKFRYLEEMLSKLQIAGYVELVEKVKPHTSRYYRLIKYTGVKSPNIQRGTLYDYNTNEEIDVDRKPVIVRFLSSLRDEKITMEMMIRDADIVRATAKVLLKKLKEIGVLSDIKPIERIDGVKAFAVNYEKVKALEEEIDSGALKAKSFLTR